MKKHIRKLTLLLVLVSFNLATATVIDFTTDDGGVALVNGQEIATPGEFGNLVNVTGVDPTGNNPAVLAIFDTDPNGPNAANSVALQTDDVLVGQGNALIFQNTGTQPTQTVAGIFDTPLDKIAGGIMLFDFISPTMLQSLDFIDLDLSSLPGNRNATVTLTDTNGNTRTYDVPSGFTNNLRDEPTGFATLDLTTLADQTGETALLATAVQDAGFDAAAVMQMAVQLRGSGGIDNIVIIPEPTSFVLFGLGLLGLIARRSNRRK